MSTTRLLVVHARSPLHAGTGQSTAAVDLPIARDRATGLPLLPGSSIKGALRARARDKSLKLSRTWLDAFGPETENASDHAGAVAVTDARLLLLPVRSVAGTFAWVTSPLLVAGLRREARLAGVDIPAGPQVKIAQTASVSKDSLLRVKLTGAGGQQSSDKVVLEEFDLDPLLGADDLATALGPLVFPKDPDWQALLRRRLCVVHDDVMSFLSQHATDIVTRVSIDPATGTAKKAQLWTEENLPAETVLVGLLEELPTQHTRPDRAGDLLTAIQRQLLNRPIQLGGKATVGRGRCVLTLSPGAQA